MPKFIPQPTRIPVPGGKVIDEHVGRVNTGTDAVSVAHMVAPPGWDEPHQQPQLDEITLVLRGAVIVDHEGGPTTVSAGQSIITSAGERIRYRCGDEGAEYVAVCLPAFSPETVGREEDEEGAGA